MRIHGSKNVHYDSGPNMTPLVDIVMVILIFLMLAGVLSGTEHYLVSEIPAGAGRPTGPPPLPSPEFQIFVDPAGPGLALYKPAGQDAVNDTQLLASRLVTVRDQLGKARRGEKGQWFDSTTRVVLIPRDDVAWQPLIDGYQAALEAGFTKVSFALAQR